MRGPWHNSAMSASDEALRLALAQRAGGDLGGAIDILWRAVSADLSDATLATNLAKMLTESGQIERAEPWFRHALKLSPDDLDLRLAYGTFLGQRGDTDAARVCLTALMKDLERLLDDATALGDTDAILEIRRFLGVASINLGRAALDSGDAATAIDFARPWLDDAEYHEAAQALIADALDSDALDPHRLAELSLASGRVTPAVVTLLIDTALARVPPDLASIERALAAAQRSLPDGWWRGEEALVRVLGMARAELGRAVMRGGLDPRDFPALLSVQAS